ncbi:MAG: S8 family serine peptidase, partial [Bacteroidia bacterium]
MQKQFFTLLICCFLTTWVNAQQTNVRFTERLVKEIQSSQPNDYLQVLILMKEQANTEELSQRLYASNASLSQRSQEVISLLQNTAALSQKELLADLRNGKSSGKVKFFDAYWITNLVVASVKRDYLYELQNRTDLMTIDLDGFLKLDAVTQSEKVAKSQANSSEAGACIINAKPLWALGFTGCGRTVMGMDTGVDGTHPALSSRWKGNFVPSSQAWLDQMTSPFTSSPTDCDGHGTHTVGTMVGLDAANNDTIGIAFGAQWMAAQTICSSPHTSFSIAAFQWAINPDNNASTTADRPDVINCSWYDPNTTACDVTYQTTLTNVEAAGIAVVFSAGNAGSGVSTITYPKSINVSLTNTFTVANVNAQTCGGVYTIASSSSRGPSDCGGVGSLNIKPEVSAPGTSVRSSYVGGGYAYLTGTSMAAPHVAGAIALLKEAYPNHTGEQIKLALYNTCVDMGAVGEDNTYGMGMIDVYAAYQYLQTNATSSFYQPHAPCDMRCSGLTTLTGCSGSFSDGSGSFLYPNYANCKWLISTPAGTAPTLSFSAFDLESGYDYVYVYDGPDSLSPLLGSFTGASIPAAVTASGNNMFVRFTSDYIVRDNGFVANYSAAPKPVITGPSATCYGTAGVLTASSTGCSSCTYSWNLSPTNTTATHLATATGNYTVSMSNVCGTVASSPFPFTINKLPVVSAGIDKTACQGTATSIGGVATAGISYVWSPTTGLSNPSISNPTATPTTTTTYYVTAINTTTGCYKQDTMK